MPFQSKAQSDACFASNGWGHKVNCDEWAKQTDYKHLKKEKMNYRGKNKKQAGGLTNKKQPDYMWGNPSINGTEPQAPTNPNTNRLITTNVDPRLHLPDPGMNAPVDEYPTNNTNSVAWQNNNQLSLRGLKTPTYQTTGYSPIDISQQTGYQQTTNGGPLNNGQIPQTPTSDQDAINPNKKKINNKLDPFFVLRGLQNGLGFLGNKLERNRQDQYLSQQYSTLGQMKPSNINDFQPTNNNLYAQEGGQITDDQRRTNAKKVVELARGRVNNNDYIPVPDNLKKIAEGRNEEANGCIGGVCTVLKDANVIPTVNWSNTDFALHAKDYGFQNHGYGVKGLKNLEPGDVLQHNIDINKEGNYYPGHAQIFLGKESDGQYGFFDNYHKTERKYSESDLQNWLDPARKKNQRSASIYKVNPYTAPPVSQMSPEATQDSEMRASVQKTNLNSGTNYRYSIRPDAKDYSEGTKATMDKFIDFANNDEKINELVRKTGKSKEEIHDSLLNVFGELGQENKWDSTEKTSLKTDAENIFEKAISSMGPNMGNNFSVGPGQIKFSTLSKDLKDKFGITRSKDLYDIDKVIPLMAASDLKDKQVLTNWGNKNVLSDKLINKTDTEDPLTADQLKGGVGRWSPYLRNQYAGIAKGKDNANYKLGEKSYPDKVFHNIDDNLERTMYIPEGPDFARTLPEATFRSKAKKFQQGGYVQPYRGEFKKGGTIKEKYPQGGVIENISSKSLGQVGKPIQQLDLTSIKNANTSPDMMYRPQGYQPPLTNRAPVENQMGFDSYQKGLMNNYLSYGMAQTHGADTIYGAYDGGGVHNKDNPSQLDQILNNIEYMKHNSPDSNSYKLKDTHHSINLPRQPMPNAMGYAKKGGMLRPKTKKK